MIKIKVAFLEGGFFPAIRCF